MEENKKQQISTIFFIFSLFIFIVTILFIRGITGGENKIAELNNKNNKIKELNTQVKENEAFIKTSMDDINYKKEELDILKMESTKSKDYIDQLDLELHLPSFLVDIGLKAKELNLDLIINYNDRQDLGSQAALGNMVDDIIDDIKPGDKENPEDIEDISEEVEEEIDADSEDSVKEDDAVETTEDSEDKAEKKDKKVPIQSNISYYYNGNLETIDQMSIPLNIKGNYNNVRSFLYYIDNLDVIDSRSISLESDGDEVSGDIMLHIFYKGVRR